MAGKRQQYNSIDEYIASFPEDKQKLLKEMRAIIKEAAPQATEKISYQMPAFEQNGILVYFAAFKDHIGFYPTASGIAAFQEKFKGYKSSKGAVQFPSDKPLPLKLIEQIVKFRVRENKQKAEQKTKISKVPKTDQ